MAVITTRFGSGHANLAPGGNQGQPTLADALRDVADDIAEHRTALTVLTQQMDADAGITDTDYEANVVTAAAAVLTTKG